MTKTDEKIWTSEEVLRLIPRRIRRDKMGLILRSYGDLRRIEHILSWEKLSQRELSFIASQIKFLVGDENGK